MGEEVQPAEGAGDLEVSEDFVEHERVVVDHDCGQEVEANSG